MVSSKVSQLQADRKPVQSLALEAAGQTPIVTVQLEGDSSGSTVGQMLCRQVDRRLTHTHVQVALERRGEELLDDLNIPAHWSQLSLQELAWA